VVSGLIIYLGVAVAGLAAYAFARPRIEMRRHQRKLRRMTPDELAAEARDCAKGAAYDRLFPDAALFRQQRDWSQSALARALDELYARAAALDERERDPAGRGVVFDFYDFGLASVREVLDHRPPA
jgi:hypothetical protein